MNWMTQPAVHLGFRMTKAPTNPGLALPLARRHVHRCSADRHPRTGHTKENNPDLRAEPVRILSPISVHGGPCGPTPTGERSAMPPPSRHPGEPGPRSDRGTEGGPDPTLRQDPGGNAALDEESLARAGQLAGLKGYVTNIPVRSWPGRKSLARITTCGKFERSFRMSKSDLRARPMFHQSIFEAILSSKTHARSK